MLKNDVGFDTLRQCVDSVIRACSNVDNDRFDSSSQVLDDECPGNIIQTAV